MGKMNAHVLEKVKRFDQGLGIFSMTKKQMIIHFDDLVSKFIQFESHLLHVGLEKQSFYILKKLKLVFTALCGIFVFNMRYGNLL